jgi:methyl-accepting chemotaxis protein
MRIGQKIAFGYALLLIVLLIVGWGAFSSLRDYMSARQLARETDEVESDLFRLANEMIIAESAMRGYVITGQVEFLRPYRTVRATAEELTGDLRRLLAGYPEQARRLEALVPLLREKLDWMDETIELRDQNAEAAVERVAAGTGRDLMTRIRQLGEEMEAAQSSLSNLRTEEAADTGRNAMRVVWIGTAAGLLLGLVGSYVLSRAITRPVQELVDGAARIGSGELEHRIVLRSKDEIGELAAAFNRMAERRQQAQEQLGRQAAEREEVLEAVRATVNKLASAGAELLSVSSQQASGAQEQAAAISETVATVDEVVETAEQAAQRARAVAESSERAVEIGNAGRRVVDESVGAIEAVRAQVESIAESILSLAEQAQAIGEIISTVSEIAEQTNLLALNAAIEASRAGEQGRGFAVVASEVKALAEQSKKATAQVRQILGEIQKATNSAVIATEDGTKGALAAVNVVSQAGSTIKELTRTLDDAAQTAAQIAASARQQSAGTTQIHQAMQNINEAMKQSLASTRQTERAVQDLTALGRNLQELLPGTRPDGG